MRKHQQLQVDGRELTVSNLDKVYFPESGFTKGEVIAFYSAISDTIIAHLCDRPLTLKRYPEGVTGEHFYEKNAPSHTPEWVKRAPVPRSEGEGEIKYVLCNDKATLIWATNLGDIEKHVLLAKFPDLNFPTALVFDLDPGEPAGIIDCCKVALELKKVFEALKLECFVKVSGSKGLHISVPLNSKTPYEVAQPFAKTVAELMAKNMPDRVVADMAKSLRKGKVLIDWSQNSDFKTTVAVYAMRAKRGEPFISIPVTWLEVAKAAKSGNESPRCPSFLNGDDAMVDEIHAVHRYGLPFHQSLGSLFPQNLAHDDLVQILHGGDDSQLLAANPFAFAKCSRERKRNFGGIWTLVWDVNAFHGDGRGKGWRGNGIVWPADTRLSAIFSWTVEK